jgi:hypothetical protein
MIIHEIYDTKNAKDRVSLLVLSTALLMMVGAIAWLAVYCVQTFQAL